MFSTVPVCDLNDFKNDKKRGDFVQIFGSAIQQLGFVRVVNHGISQSLIQQTYDIGKKFFLELDEETKKKYHCSKAGGNRGYASFGEEVIG